MQAYNFKARSQKGSKVRTFKEMENAFYQDVRQELVAGLLKTTEAQQVFFRRMYSPKDLAKPLDQVVEGIERGRLGWALQQVQNTLDRWGTSSCPGGEAI